MNDLINPPDPEEDATDKFEVMEEEEFEVMDVDSEKRKNEIKEKLMQCCEELSGMTSKLL